MNGNAHLSKTAKTLTVQASRETSSVELRGEAYTGSGTIMKIRLSLSTHDMCVSFVYFIFSAQIYSF